MFNRPWWIFLPWIYPTNSSIHLFFSYLKRCGAMSSIAEIWFRRKKAFSYACFKPYLNYLQLQVCKSLTKLPPGHFSNEQTVSSTLSPWMWNEHRGWTLEPTSLLLPSTTLTSAAAFQSVLKGEKAGSPPQAGIARRTQYILWLQRLSKGCSAALRSSERLCECGASQLCPPPADHQLLGSSRCGDLCRAAKGEGFLDCTSERRAELWAERVQRDPSRHWIPLQSPQTPFSIKRQGGREGEQRRKEKISCTTIQRMWLGRNESLLKAVIKVVHLCNQSQ